MPHQKAAYEKFRSRGFEILGMNVEILKEKPDPEDYKTAVERCRDFIAKNDMKWPEASQESIYDISQHRFLVHAYPTLALMDPTGKILALGQDVRGPKLDALLEKLLSGKADAASAK